MKAGERHLTLADRRTHWLAASLDELRERHEQLCELVNDPADETTSSGLRGLETERDRIWYRIEELEGQ